MKREPDMLHVNGLYFVRKVGDRYVVCDREGCGPGLEHEGDTYESLSVAISMVNFWALGGHWMNRPDVGLYT